MSMPGHRIVPGWAKTSNRGPSVSRLRLRLCGYSSTSGRVWACLGAFGVCGMRQARHSVIS